MTETCVVRSIVDSDKQKFLFDSAQNLQTCLQVSVVIPVRNEAVHLNETLDALRMQVDNNEVPLPASTYEVLVLANNCTDQSAAIAFAYQKKHPKFLLQVQTIQLPPAKANIGTVRRLLMDEAYRRLYESGNSNGIIASTDGDTVVDKKWVYNIISEVKKGCDAVGGRILTKNDNSPVRLYHLRDVMYRSLVARAESILDPAIHDPWPRHFQYFGASLAVTCSMYDRAGRLPKVPYLEDNAFYMALKKVDAKVRKSNLVKVYTSTRTNGRVEIGFSEQLQKWNMLAKQSVPQIVEPAEALLIKFKNRFALRICWSSFLQTGYCSKDVIIIARSLHLSPIWLKQQLEHCQFFGELWHLVELEMNKGDWNCTWKPVSITSAITVLRLFIERQYLVSEKYGSMVLCDV